MPSVAQYKEPFSYDKRLATKLVKLGYGKDVKIIDGETAKLKPAKAKYLAMTYKLFTSGKPAKEYLKSAEKNIKAYIAELFRDNNIKKSLFKVDVSYGADDGHYAFLVTLTSKKTGVERFVGDEALHWESDGDFEDTIQQEDWAFWLMDEDSPFYDQDFVDAYAATQAGQALEQFAQTLDESSFESEFIHAVKFIEKSDKY